MTRQFLAREAVWVAILSTVYGLVFFDQNGINFLMPFIKSEIARSNAEIGGVAGAFFGAFVVSSFLTGKLAGRVGDQRRLLALLLLVFALCSPLPAFTGSFITLLGSRLLMGLLAGPILPLAQAIIAAEAPAWRRGLDMGIVQSVGSNLLGFLVAPSLLVMLAANSSWRSGFLLVFIPVFLMSLCIWMLSARSASAKVDFIADHDLQNQSGILGLIRVRSI